MSPFDYIRRRLTRIADVVLSVDGAYPTWSYSDLCMLLDEVEKEWSKECHEDGDTVSRQEAIDTLRKLSREDGYIDMPHEYVTDAVRALPSAQPDEKLRKIADLVEGSIDHFDRDDAMDLLYQIKEIVGNETSNI